MEDLADIINVAIEELVRGSFELPGFSTLHKEAKLGRTEVNRGFYQRIQDAIGANGRTAIDTLLSESGSQSRKTRWDSLKQDARSNREGGIGVPTSKRKSRVKMIAAGPLTITIRS
jgi:hypothetical protein